MYIQAESDRLVRAESLREIQRLRPDTVLALIPAPHLVLQREPQKAAEIIVRFIRQLAG
jgi:pimeloyl-ACP methyl ester carboxylesterase